MWSSWAEFLNVPEDFEVEETYPAESNFEFPNEDANVFGPHSMWNDFYLVICKICGNTVRSQILQTHMEQKHLMKVLQPHNTNRSTVESGHNVQPSSQHNEHDRRMENLEERLPGTSSRLNGSNYNLKYCRENTNAKAQVRKHMLIAKLRKRLL